MSNAGSRARRFSPRPASRPLTARCRCFGALTSMCGASETVLLLGANGAGKDHDIESSRGPHGRQRPGHDHLCRRRHHSTCAQTRRMRRGIAYMSELGVFPDLTIAENIRVGAQAVGRVPKSRVEPTNSTRFFPVLREKRDRSRIELVRRTAEDAWHRQGAGKRASAAGDGRAIRRPVAFVRGRSVFARCHRCAASGLSLLIAEQNIGFLDIADRVLVLEGGHIRFAGTVAAMSGDTDLHKAYFGLK